MRCPGIVVEIDIACHIEYVFHVRVAFLVKTEYIDIEVVVPAVFVGSVPAYLLDAGAVVDKNTDATITLLCP